MNARTNVFSFSFVFAPNKTDDKVEVIDQRVAVCRDHAKSACKRQQCKYYHIPVVVPPANVMADIFNCNPRAEASDLTAAERPIETSIESTTSYVGKNLRSVELPALQLNRTSASTETSQMYATSSKAIATLSTASTAPFALAKKFHSQ